MLSSSLQDVIRCGIPARSARQSPWVSALADGLSARDIEAATKILRAVRSRLEAEAARGEGNEL